MRLFSDGSDILALMERIKFNIEIQRVFSELYVCVSEGGNFWCPYHFDVFQ